MTAGALYYHQTSPNKEHRGTGDWRPMACSGWPRWTPDTGGGTVFPKERPPCMSALELHSRGCVSCRRWSAHKAEKPGGAPLSVDYGHRRGVEESAARVVYLYRVRSEAALQWLRGGLLWDTVDG
ncbi:hypothetical protein NDU88_007659 [Pleurodeles waltl]|uniref:Uncharacterized protein n=1 Tax=Pleurodeles waltl TaxID=8319 RepID=A0AAV7PS29_PLEWA|nr:hypothetical protein NDU88_007659 [Pleurodeles waltl]